MQQEWLGLQEKKSCFSFSLALIIRLSFFFLLLLSFNGILCVTSKPVVGRDFYKILGVPRDADVSLIKKRYRQLSKELHPDANSNISTQAFIDVRDAHEALVNPETRKLYDTYGEQGLDPNFNPKQSNTFQPSGSFFFKQGDGHSFFFSAEDHSDPFASFFSHRQDFYKQSHRRPDLFSNTKSSVVKITPRNWENEIDRRSWVALINFYSPGCGHCVRFEPVYESLAATFKDILHIGAVNCEKFNQFCHKHNIKYFPSLFLYHDPTKKYSHSVYPGFIFRGIFEEVA